ncbi:MAG: hypothetical protein ACYC27_15670 [Armatimonadota bacterium]
MKRVKRFLKGVLILVLVLAVIHGIASIILGRRVASKIADIKAQGDPVSLLELGKIVVPDSENGAVIYNQIFKEIGRPLVYTDGVPYIKEDTTKNYDYKELLTGEEITPEMWTNGERSLATYQHAFDLVDEAASKPECKFVTNWEDGDDVRFPYYASLRELSRMLMLDARISARNGNMDKAVKRTGQIFKVSKSVNDEPVFISHLVNIAMISTGLKNIREIEQYGNLNAAQAKYLDDILAQIDLSNHYLLAIKGERSFGIDSYNKYRNNPFRVLWEMNSEDSIEPPFYLGILGWVARPVVYMDEMVYIDFMSKKIQNADLPFIKTPLSKPDYDETDELPKYALTSRMVIPVFTKAQLARDTGISGIRSGRAYLGAIVYKERFGVYPQSLDDLRSRLGWKVEKDPLTGKDFQYKRKGAGFLLYGVGPNLHDDGGVFRKRKMTDTPNQNLDDIVWERMN